MAEHLPPGNLQLTLSEIAVLIGGKLDGPADLFVERLTSLDNPDRDGIAFAENAALISADGPWPRALIVTHQCEVGSIPAIRVESPRASFFHLLDRAQQGWKLDPGHSPLASIHPNADVSRNANVGAFAVIEEGAYVAAGASVHPFAYIGSHCRIGEGSTIGPRAALVEHVTIGKRSIIHAGAVLGSDGFGFFWNGKFQQKIPQVGRIEIGDDVEIGALTAIDRATAGFTRIGNGCKLDNLVQIGHNCQIGDHVVIAAHCAVGGSTRIGNRCTIGGRTAVSDHMIIVDDVRIGGGSMVSSHIMEPGDYFGLPVKPAGIGRRNYVLMGNLATMQKRINELEVKLAELEARSK